MSGKYMKVRCPLPIDRLRGCDQRLSSEILCCRRSFINEDFPIIVRNGNIMTKVGDVTTGLIAISIKLITLKPVKVF